MFGEGKYRYVFENICEENGKKLEDGTKKIFLNSKGTNGKASEDLKTFLKCVEGEFNSTEFSAKIKSAVDKVINNEQWKVEYMYQFIHDEDIRRQERKLAEEKIKEKVDNERKLAIKNMLTKMTPEEIIELGYDEEMVVQVASKKE